VKLHGKSAIVTGAGSGIGRQIAQRFVRVGAKVCFADFNAEAAQSAAAEAADAAAKDGGIAVAERMDVTDEAEVEAVTQRVSSRWSGIDILVSNAGIQHLGAIADISYENWKKVLTVHLDGSFLTARAALRSMRSYGRGGSILLMGSVHSYFASEDKGPYVVAKHGLVGLCRTLAKEGARHGIRANTICPGLVDTPLIARQLPVLAKELGMTEQEVVQNLFLRLTVDGEYTAEADLAEVAVFLASFPSKALTGQSVSVSHGMHML
jgi:3-hydroxybutyrate dehydrogenase